MKKYICFLFTLLPLFLYADVGRPYIIRAKFILKNGTSFVGYYQTNVYYDVEMKYQNDKGFQQLLNEESKEHNYNVTIFKSYYLEPITKLGFVNEKEIINLNPNELKYTVFYKVLDVYYALSHMKKVSNWFYNEVKERQKTQYVKFGSPNDVESHVLSFNSNCDWKETCKLTRNLCEYLNGKSSVIGGKNYSKKEIDQFEAQIKELENQFIFIFTIITFTC